MSFTAQSYTSARCEAWDAFVLQAAKPTFLLQRGYMDYHADRFADCSLMLYDAHGHLQGLLPACHDAQTRTVASHGGLTYGGIVTAPSAHAADVMAMLDAATQYYADTLHAQHLSYRAVPYIYGAYPAEADLYWLFRQGARLAARGLSAAIDLRRPLPLATLRQRGVRKAERLQPQWVQDAPLATFWPLLEKVLLTRHGVRPVHTLAEMELLKSRFPANIRLHTATLDGTTQAGVLIYETPHCAHAQYIAASGQAREGGLLDWLFERIITHYAQRPQPPRYFDFGISTEAGGTRLNEGLLHQKEGFGARAVCYDTYDCSLS